VFCKTVLVVVVIALCTCRQHNPSPTPPIMIRFNWSLSSNNGRQPCRQTRKSKIDFKLNNHSTHPIKQRTRVMNTSYWLENAVKLNDQSQFINHRDDNE